MVRNVRAAVAACVRVGVLAAAPAAVAADKNEAAEEIVVYGDDFARWDHTRWFVQNELLFPMGATFASEQNLSFRSLAFQIRTVLLCDKDGKLGKHRMEVSCTIEDIGLLVTTASHWRRARDRENVQKVLDEIDAKLTGMQVQMQVQDDGAIRNFDVEGITAENAREIAIQETLRQVLSRMMAGFHLSIPDHAQRSGQWVEYHSELLDMPSLTASRGSTLLAHMVSPYGDMQLVQSKGEGSVSVAIPVAKGDPFERETGLTDKSGDVTIDKGLGGEGASAEAPGAGSDAAEADQIEGSLEVTYKLDASGVAVFRKADGIMSERVWTVIGVATAGGAGGGQTPPYRNVGRIQQIGRDDTPSVGETKQVAWPGRTMPGLDPWVGLETMPE